MPHLPVLEPIVLLLQRDSARVSTSASYVVLGEERLKRSRCMEDNLFFFGGGATWGILGGSFGDYLRIIWGSFDDHLGII